MGDIQTTSQHEIVAAEDRGPAGLFLPEEFGRAFLDAGVSPTVLISEIAGILTDKRTTFSEKGGEKLMVPPRDRLAAAKLLLEIEERMAKRNGLLQKVTGHVEQYNADGSRSSIDIEGLRILREGSSKTIDTLTRLQQGKDHVIDLEQESGSADTYSVSTSTTEPNNGPANTGRPVSTNRNVSRKSPVRGESGRDSSNRSGDDGPVHVDERPDPSATRGGPDDDQATITGAEDERSSGVSEQSGRGSEGEVAGGGRSGDERRDQRDSKPTEWWNERKAEPTVRDDRVLDDKHPYVPGAHLTAGTDASATRIPRRSDDDRGGSPGITTAESLKERFAKLLSVKEQKKRLGQRSPSRGPGEAETPVEPRN